MARRTNRLPLWERLIYAIPIFGWMLKDVVHGDPDNIYYFMATLVMMWILAGMIFGYPGIIIPAVIYAIVILALLVIITRG